MVKPFSNNDSLQSSAKAYISGTTQQIYLPPLNVSQKPIAKEEMHISKNNSPKPNQELDVVSSRKAELVVRDVSIVVMLNILSVVKSLPRFEIANIAP